MCWNFTQGTVGYTFASRVRRRLIFGFLCYLFNALAAECSAIYLPKSYSTSLTAGDTTPDRARPWEFTRADVFQIVRFRFELDKDFRIETGIADLGIGHC